MIVTMRARIRNRISHNIDINSRISMRIRISIDKMIGILFHRRVLYEDLFLIRKERIKLGYMHGSKAAEKETYIDRMEA